MPQFHLAAHGKAGLSQLLFIALSSSQYDLVSLLWPRSTEVSEEGDGVAQGCLGGCNTHSGGLRTKQQMTAKKPPGLLRPSAMSAEVPIAWMGQHV